VLLLYLVATSAYTFVLKRKMIADIVVLSSLYSIRIVAGALAVDVPLSEWMLQFSLFIFTSLALMKRYVELATRLDANLPNPENRNYQKQDLPIIGGLAATSAFNAVTVFGLYVSSEAVRHLYRSPTLLWLVCPILVYWLARALLMAHRRLMHDDPIVFALKDRNSWFSFGLIACIMAAAS
jgi:4-hydroxybenzoate polyprenyltransferase